MRTINYSLRVILNFHWLQEGACGTAEQPWQWDRGLLHAGAQAERPKSLAAPARPVPPSQGVGSTGGSWSTVPACQELTEAMSTEHEPPGTPRACLGCCTVLQKAKLSWTHVFPAVQTHRWTRGLLLCRTRFSLLWDRNHQFRYCERRSGKPTASLYSRLW